VSEPNGSPVRTAPAAVAVFGDGPLSKAVGIAVAGVRCTAPAACVVATVPPPAPLQELSDIHLSNDVAAALAAVLAWVQQALDTMSEGGGRLVFLLPYAPLLGAPGCVAPSAVTNGVLSMARTLAIELARDQISVNVLAIDDNRLLDEGLHERGDVGRDGVAGVLATQLAALLGPDGGEITGQEIYLTAGSDLGRLHP